jgi:hypothetical protein
MSIVYDEQPQDFTSSFMDDMTNNIYTEEPIEMIIYKHGIIFNHPNTQIPKYLNEVGNYEVSRIYIYDDELDHSVTNKTKHIYYLTDNTSNIPILPVYFTSLFSLNKYILRNKHNLNKIYGKWNKDLWYVKATNSIYDINAKKR